MTPAAPAAHPVDAVGARRSRIPWYGARLALGIAPLLPIFVVTERGLMDATRLREASYYERSITWELVLQVLTQKGALLAIAGLLALALWRGPLLWRRWSDLDDGRVLQVVVGGLALVFAWVFSTYHVNVYFDRSHGFDRALLVGLALLACWRPVFLLGFLPLLLAMIWQFEYPLGGFSWTDKIAPLRVLMLFLAWFVWLAISGGRRTEAFVFTACCLVAAHYWIPGLEKLRLGWLGHGNLHHLALAAWRNGWLVSLGAPEIVSLVRAVAVGEPLALAFTIAAEAGAVFMMLRRNVALALLGSWIVLHAGIFALSGICFWKWALMDAGLIAVLLSLGPAASARMFGAVPLLISLTLIVAAPLWCPPVRLGWYDTRVADTYQYTVLGHSGRAYRIAASHFAPLDLPMAQNRLAYLSQRPALVSTYGMTQNRDIAELLLGVRTFAELEALEARFGTTSTDARRAARFDEFARRAVAAKHAARGERPWYTAVHPPLHIWTAARDPAYTGAEPARLLLVDRVTTLWDGERLHERVERVREIAIAAEPAGGP